jgi:eukaryotic-like serine/threonine-protein kinase
MFCGHCGAEAASGEGFCRQCGSALEVSPVAPLDSSTSASTRPVAQSQDDVPTVDPAGSASRQPSSAPVLDGSFAPGQAFGRRYRIIRELGRGGMGVVYQAWDEELGIAVALKTIRPDPDADPETGRERELRFKRELVLARQVTHKHVVRIHDLGEINGIKYLTMPFIQGESLAARVRRQGRLPVDRALHFAKQIAAGLVAAHDAGVVHRDLKPANIMIDAEEQAIILDFGLARSTSGMTLGTATGAVMGTIQYMAPEQASGAHVDERADIYAFGLIFHEMLVGSARSTESPVAIAMRRMQEPPPSVHAVDPTIPAPVDRIVQRCLQPDPALRYQTSAELASDLAHLDSAGLPRSQPVAPVPVTRRPRWLLPAVGLVVLALLSSVGLLWMRVRGTPAAPSAREPVSVLIADFANKTGDEVFDGSLEQPLGIGVEGASFITTYPRRDALRSARQIKPGATGIDETMARLICQREAIKVVLAGSIERAGPGYAVSIRVLDPVPGKEIGRLTAKASGKGDVLQAVGILAGKAREALGDTVTQSARAAAQETFTAASIEAARDYARAQALANANKDKEAVVLYQRALAEDPNLGRAYSGWAASAIRMGRKDEAEQLYRKALALVDRMTEREKYRTLGAYYLNVAGNYEKAIENFEALIRKYPADGAGHNNLAIAYFGTLYFAKALEEGRRVLAIYPNSPLYRSNYALYAMYAGDVATADMEGRKMAQAGDFLAYLPVAMAALARSTPAEAIKVYEQARATGAEGQSLASIGLADIALAQWRGADAVSLLRPGIAADLAEKNQVGAAAKEIALAEAHWQLGRTEDALDAVTRALKLDRDLYVMVPASRILLDAGRESEASALAANLDGQLQTRQRAYAAVLKAQLALARKQPAEAVSLALEGRKHADLWLLRFTLGVAYVQAGAHAEALSELESCVKRRGEATALFLNDLPTYRYSVSLAYWLARAQEGLGMRDAATQNYKAYLSFRPQPCSDAMGRDAARRLKDAAPSAAVVPPTR